jgi:hypothetical protein
MGRACCRDGRVGFCWKNVTASDHLKYVGVDVRLILKCTYNRNIEAHSRKHSCRGKEMTITYSECASVACIAGCCLSGCPIFFHIIAKTTRFSGKRY